MNATMAARALLQTLGDLGLRHVVLAPGSRSAPLAFAVAEAARPDRSTGAPTIDLHVRLDERVAGFLALGLARAAALRGDDALVAVVTTSGTAVANLHPAVLEAHHSGVPLLLLTADRPGELRGVGANQTTDQVGIFASAVRATFDVPAPTGDPRAWRRVAAAAAAAARADPGPVHLNLCFREPLVPDGSAWPASEPPPSVSAPREPDGTSVALDWDVAPTVVVAGDGAGGLARDIAEVNGWPLFAEPSSGSRGGGAAIPGYRLLLEAGMAATVRRVVVVGRPTLSRAVQALIAGSQTAVLAQGFRPPGAVLLAGPQGLLDGSLRGPQGWLAQWQRAGVLAAGAIRRAIDPRSGGALNGPAVAAEVGSLGPEGVLLVGASSPIRDLDLVASWSEPPVVVANRGVSGIDGTVATAAGLALGLGRGVRVYLGDLAFLHDVGALLTGPLEHRPDLQIVVANDDGGAIFATLEQGAPEHAAVFERVFATPQGADLGALTEGLGGRHVRVTDRLGLRAALAAPARGISVIEAVVDRAGRRALHARLLAAVRETMAG